MKKALNILKTAGLITLGSLIYAFAFDWLFAPNNIAMGGLTGLSQIVNHYFPFLPVGVLVVVMNVPLFIIGVRLQGPKLLFSSLFAMLVSSVFIDVIPLFITFEPMEDKFLVSVFGGVLVGLGSGLMLLVGATTGGTELGARLLKYKFRHVSIGRLCLIIDLCVIALYTLAFRSVENALYAAVAMYIINVAMDAVIYGTNKSKVAFIVCADGEAMKEKLIALDLGVTRIEAKGGYSSEKKDILICAFKPSRISAIKTAVINIDKTAFVIICRADDVFGEGFAECSLNSL